jgi:hypothetical protein
MRLVGSKKLYCSTLVVSQYETIKSSHNVSGTHMQLVNNIETIIEDKLISAFCQGRILYTHLLLEQQPGVFETAAAFLGENVSRESSDVERNEMRLMVKNQKRTYTKAKSKPADACTNHREE